MKILSPTKRKYEGKFDLLEGQPLIHKYQFVPCLPIVFQIFFHFFPTKESFQLSLVGGLYEWLTKVLANRLKKVLAKVISKTQNAFVEPIQILDVVLVANEATDSILRNNGGFILCKLDTEKAYDHVDWSFLCWVIEKMGFSEK